MRQVCTEARCRLEGRALPLLHRQLHPVHLIQLMSLIGALQRVEERRVVVVLSKSKRALVRQVIETLRYAEHVGNRAAAEPADDPFSMRIAVA